jgi:hypothetical protein
MERLEVSPSGIPGAVTACGFQVGQNGLPTVAFSVPESEDCYSWERWAAFLVHRISTIYPGGRTIVIGGQQYVVDAEGTFGACGPGGAGSETCHGNEYATDIGHHRFYRRTTSSTGAIWLDVRTELAYARIGDVEYGANPVAAEQPPTRPVGRLAVAPNPADAAASVRLTLAATAAARVVVYDALGREAAVLRAGELPAGVHTFEIVASSLPPGVYMIRATAEDWNATVPLLVVR